MTTLAEHSPAELTALAESLQAQYELTCANGMGLDLSRGKPSAEQLALSDALDGVLNGDYRSADGIDVRNYGGLVGLREARELGAELLDAPLEEVIAAGNSSLWLMHLVVETAQHYDLWGDGRSWRHSLGDTTQAKILTPVPGYDRHFALSDALGLDMVTIDMTDDGPNLEQAQQHIAKDASIKGIWCVPKYANPTGCIYSDAVVDGISKLPKIAKADDFLVLWDNAYAVHDFDFPTSPLASLTKAAKRAGTQDHMVQFASTSKITFAGAGVAFLATSATVRKQLIERLSLMMVGPDKVNQLRHARFLRHRLEEHMQAHADILRPKFELVEQVLSEELGELCIATWTKPQGGYFVSLDLPKGTAKAVVNLAKAAGLTLTPAGATFPHGDDPNDRNVRIAPTFASLTDLKAAMHTLVLCVKLCAVKQLVETNP